MASRKVSLVKSISYRILAITITGLTGYFVTGSLIFAATIVYIDTFGNLITNIPNNHFSDLISEIRCGVNICNKVENYGGGFFRKLSILEGSHGYLEIFLKEFSASQEFGIKKGQEVTIKLKES